MKRKILSIYLLASFIYLYSKPNLVILFSDDAGYGDFGFQGSTDFITPELDKMAVDGIKFDQGYVSSAVCHPSRVGIMTGRNPARIGQPLNSDCRLPDTTITIADQMKSAGYKTMLIGKWHLGNGSDGHPSNYGFDEFYGHQGGSHNYFSGNLNRNGITESVPQGSYLTDLFGQEAVSFIDRNKNNPFFLFVSFNAPHSPYQAKPEHTNLFQASYWPVVGGMTFSLDSNIGLIINKIEQENLSDSTLIFYLNDNGGATNHNNNPLSGKKGTTLEGGVRVPFLVRWDGVLPRGIIYNHPISSMDIFATASYIAGVPLPSDRKYDGINLIPFLTGERNDRPHKYLYFRAWQFALRYKDYKFISGGRIGDYPLLYDLSIDIKEENNLVENKPGLTYALKEELNRFISEETLLLDNCTPDSNWENATRNGFEGRLESKPFQYIDSGIVLEPETGPDITLSMDKVKWKSKLRITKYQDGFRIYINQPQPENISKLEILNFHGKRITTIQLDNTSYFWNGLKNSGQKIKSGVYLLRVKLEQGSTETHILNLSV